ncbi:MAG: glycosyltransferase family 4 protein [Acidimicrobiia bacterium]
MTIPRVALVAPVNLDRLSGTPVRAKTTARALQERLSATIVATGGSLPAQHVVEAWKPRGNRGLRFRLGFFTWGVLRILWQQRPDIVHAVTPAALPAGLFYRLIARKTRLVFEVHGLIRYEMQQARLIARCVYRALDRLGLRFADVVIAMSEAQRNHLVSLYGLDSRRIHVLWGPVELREYPPVPVPGPAPRIRFGYLGGASFWQDLRTIVAAAECLRDRKDIELLMAGVLPSEVDAAPPNMTFLGKIPIEEGVVFLHSCDVLLSPRLGGRVTDLQYPHKLSHYLAAGRPVIGAEVNDQAAIITRAQCGYTFSPGHVGSLVKAIERMASLSHRERTSMGEAARTFAEEHLSVEHLLHALTAIYEEIRPAPRPKKGT